MTMILKPTRFNRALTLAGALFFFYSCASRSVQPWNLRDIHSLDAHVLNTKQWLKRTKEDNKDLKKLLRKEMKKYKDKDFSVYQRLESLSARMESAIKKVNKMNAMQNKLGKLIKRNPRLIVFVPEQTAVPDTAIDDQDEKKKGLFKRRKKKDTEYAESEEPRSEKAIEILSKLEENSISIIEAQSAYTENRGLMIELFEEEGMRLVFIRDQVGPWKFELNELKYRRAQLQPRVAAFYSRLNEAFFQSAESAYSQNFSDASEVVEEYEKDMNQFEEYVKGLEKSAKKEARKAVYIIPADKSKTYEKKYRKGYQEYKDILYDLRKLLESV